MFTRSGLFKWGLFLLITIILFFFLKGVNTSLKEKYDFEENQSYLSMQKRCAVWKAVTILDTYYFENGSYPDTPQSIVNILSKHSDSIESCGPTIKVDQVNFLSDKDRPLFFVIENRQRVLLNSINSFECDKDPIVLENGVHKQVVCD